MSASLACPILTPICLDEPSPDRNAILLMFLKLPENFPETVLALRRSYLASEKNVFSISSSKNFSNSLAQICLDLLRA